MPSGRVTQTKNPPSGVVQCTPSGSSSARAPSIASHRSRYSARIERRWPRQSYSVRYAVTSIWVSGDGHSTTASQAR